MKKTTFITLSLLVLFFVRCKSKESEQTNSTQVLSVTKTYIAKDSLATTMVETVPFDVSTFYCVVELNKIEKGAKINATLIAVNAEGFENFEVRSLEATTDSLSNRVVFPFSLARPWFKGSYRCDIMLNEQVAVSTDFMIQ